MFDIEIFCDKTITAEELEMVKNAARMTAAVYGGSFAVSGEVRWDTDGCPDIPGSCDEIISEAPEDKEGRKNVSRIMDLMTMVMKAREKNGAMIIFTGKDLFLKKSWCFGAARIGGGVSVQSVTRYRKLTDEEKQAVITRTLRHEVGHIHKCAADPKRANTEQKYGRHCTSAGCTMRQSPTLKTLLKHAKEEDPGNCLCSLCRKDLEIFKAENY